MYFASFDYSLTSVEPNVDELADFAQLMLPDESEDHSSTGMILLNTRSTALKLC